MANPALEQAIINRIQEKGISLPTLPDVAMRAKSIAEDINSSADQLVDVISRDPAITARLIQVANSPLYRGAQRIENLTQVVTRLGMRTVSNLIVTLAMQQLFRSPERVLQQKMRKHWEFSTQVAALSNMLARKHSRLDPDQALLAGLLHGIGGLPVIAIAGDIPKLLSAPAVLDELVESLQPRLGVQIVKAWDFPEMFLSVIRDCADLGRDHDGPPDYTDVVVVAIAQAKGWETTADGQPIPAAAKLDVDLAVNPIDEELEETMRALIDGV